MWSISRPRCNFGGSWQRDTSLKTCSSTEWQISIVQSFQGSDLIRGARPSCTSEQAFPDVDNEGPLAKAILHCWDWSMLWNNISAGRFVCDAPVSRTKHTCSRAHRVHKESHKNTPMYHRVLKLSHDGLQSNVAFRWIQTPWVTGQLLSFPSKRKRLSSGDARSWRSLWLPELATVNGQSTSINGILGWPSDS